MENLILTVRLNALQSGLERGIKFMNQVQQRGQDLAKLLSGLIDRKDSVASCVYQIGDLVYDYAKALRNSEYESIQRAQELSDAIRIEVKKIDDLLRTARKTIEPMKARTLNVRGKIEETLKHAIAEKAIECIIDLRVIEQKLKAAEVAEATSAQRLVGEAWDDYIQKAEKQSQPLLAEYVDFLGGLALRETGFDEGLCQIADELIDTVNKLHDVNWDSLTIPARHEAVSTELARMIRLGYPEWTLWSLPLAAHEFGQVVVNQDGRFMDFIADQAKSGQSSLYLQEYLADAFATYALGPAYASAVLCLRLNLVSAYSDGDERPATAKRAHVILSTLEWVDNNRNDGHKPYSKLIIKLKREWSAALLQTKNEGCLSDETKKQLDAYVSFMGGSLRSNQSLHLPSLKSVTNWPTKLLTSERESIDIDGTEEFRDVLNAAWMCRLDHPGHPLEIRIAADSLWARVNGKKKESRDKRTWLEREDK